MRGDDERRLFRRVGLKWPITIQCGVEAIRSETHDVSIGGAYVRHPDPAVLGDAFNVFLGVPMAPRGVRAQARVVWVNDCGRGERTGPVGAGIEYTAISSEDRHFLAGQIAQYA